MTLAVNISVTLPFFLTATVAVRLKDDLGFGERGLGLLFAIWALGGALASPSMGRVAERLGPETSLRLVSVWAGSILILIGAFAQSWLSLALFLLAAGLAQTLMHSSSNLWFARVLDGRRVGLAFGIKQSGGPFAALCAGVAIPTLVISLGWRWTFVIFGAVGLAASLAVPRTGIRGSGRFAPSREGDVAIRPLVVVAIGAGMGTAVSGALTGFAVVAAVDHAGMGESLAGVIFAIGALCGIGARVGLGRLTDHVHGSLFGLAAGVLATGSIGFAFLATGSATVFAVAIPFSFVTAWGWNGIFSQAVTNANPKAPGAASGITSVGSLTGVIIGPAAFGLLVDWSFAGAWLIGGVVCLLGGATLVLGRSLMRRDASTDQP